MNAFTARASKSSIPIHLVAKGDLNAFRKAQSKLAAGWLSSAAFSAATGQVVRLPGKDGDVTAVAVGAGNGPDVWTLAHAAAKLPAGRYHLASDVGEEEATALCLGWALALYRYRRYKSDKPKSQPTLAWPDAADRGEVERLYDATALARDLVNAPAEDLGPAELAREVVKVAKQYGASSRTITGPALLKQNFPAIHAVGRAATPSRAPRLVDVRWGRKSDPKVTIVGKGVVFDSGGLDIKSAAGMRHMKKDMGGSASALALAKLVMDAEIPVNLRLLIPTVENAVSADSFRPGDVLPSRSGKTIEIGNTDAEGRLILSDALFLAASDEPELIIDFATLTGAARVALGAELPAMFAQGKGLARAAEDAQDEFDPDPLWPMPLFRPYRRHLRSYIADICNTSKVGTGGAITAALFLNEFVGKSIPWIHVDTMAYNSSTRPGRPEGGEALGVRTLYRMLWNQYGA